MGPDSRNLYRNHQRRCPHRPKRRAYKKCRCPIWIDFSFAGKRIYNQSLRTRNWQEAEDLLRAWEAGDLAIREPKLPERITQTSGVRQPTGETIDAACNKFLADAEARGLSTATLYKYRLLLGRLRAFARERGLYYLGELTFEALSEFRATLNHIGTSALKRIEELRAFFRFCQDAGWIVENPAKKLRPPKGTWAPRQPFTEAEVEKIREACARYPDGVGRAHQHHAYRLWVLVELMLHTGLRIGDAATVRRDSIREGNLRLRTEKTGTDVCCPLPKWLLAALDRVQCPSHEYLFWTGESKRKSVVGDWQRALKRLFELAGVAGGHAHRFRHTFAKNLLMAGVPVESVAILMGHRSPAITLKHYSAWVRERQQQLEASVARIWAEQDRPATNQKERLKSPERAESAIQPLYSVPSRWLN